MTDADPSMLPPPTSGPRVVMLLALAVVAAIVVGAALTVPVLDSAEERRALKEASMALPEDGATTSPAPAPPTPGP